MVEHCFSQNIDAIVKDFMPGLMKKLSHDLLITHGGKDTCEPGKWEQSEGVSIHFKMYFVIGGKGFVSVQQKKTVLKPGRCYFIPKTSSLSFGCETPLTLYWLHFQPESIFFEQHLSGLKDVSLWPFKKVEHFRTTWERLQNSVFMTTPSQLLCQHSMLLWLLSDAVKGQLNGTFQLSAGIQEALDYMDIAFVDNPNLETIAQKANLSPIHFHQQFHMKCGMTPHAYMLRLRMRKAAELLLASDKPVHVVAEECGYSDPYYFSRVFKNYFDTAPRNFHEQGTNP